MPWWKAAALYAVLVYPAIWIGFVVSLFYIMQYRKDIWVILAPDFLFSPPILCLWALPSLMLGLLIKPLCLLGIAQEGTKALRNHAV